MESDEEHLGNLTRAFCYILKNSWYVVFPWCDEKFRFHIHCLYACLIASYPRAFAENRCLMFL